MSVADLPGGMLGARSRLRSLPLSLVGWFGSCNNKDNNHNNNNNNRLEMSYKITIGLKTYLETTKDWMLQCVYQHEVSKKLYSVVKESSKYRYEIDIHETETPTDAEFPTVAAQNIKIRAKKAVLERLKTSWQEKPLHGQYLTRTNQADVDKKHTHQWLRSAGLKAETDGSILASQDQCLPTKKYKTKKIKNSDDPVCRFCNAKHETFDHLISGCTVSAPTEFKQRHDRVEQYIYWKICHHYGKEVSRNWIEHHPDPVPEIANTTILWDFIIQRDRTIKANRPGIVIKDKNGKLCLLIDMAVPVDCNVSTTIYKNLSKYKDLEIEIQKMWGMNVTMIPVVIGALGVINKGTEEFTNRIPGQPCLREIQKIVLTSSAHILRRTLSM